MSDPRAAVTPMMAQYLDIKAGHPDALLFYRMGDFYEMFFDDAVAAAAALDIALTRRGKHLGCDIAMCGVPVHSAEGYLNTLIQKGFRVAVAEQTEDPAEARRRGGKSVVARAVTRLVTPGTLTEDALLDARRNNYLAALAEIRGDWALAWADISTGEFRAMPTGPARLGADLARLAPREVLLRDDAGPLASGIATEQGAAVTPLSRGSFDSDGADRRLRAAFAVGALDAFGGFGRAEIAALGAIVDYLELTQKAARVPLRPPVREAGQGAMQIDAATRRSLEITRGAQGQGGRDGSLLACIDLTVTAGGGRLLERRLSAPSCDLATIRARHDAVAHLLDARDLRADLREALRRAPDLDRALSRLALDRGGPRDLAAIRDGLGQGARIAARLAEAPPLLASAAAALTGHDALAARLDAALVAEPPHLARDGGFVAPGVDAELDAARTLRDEGRGVIAGMQADHVRDTGIASLKIRHNNVLGYFVEVTATHAERMHARGDFIHRQTTASAVRFTTPALADLETRILNAGGRALEIEQAVFAALASEVVAAAAAIGTAARALAAIDLAAAFAELAETRDWTRPEVDDSRAFAITGGRHPVVEAALRPTGAPFIANDCDLTASETAPEPATATETGTETGTETAAIVLLTGPNMAGKSTYLRQNALIALLAQTGAYVPAARAHVGLVSQLFSRVGASDDLARGRSTFMVEMVETAAILNQADARALVILDEIGRGTATYDGLSIAWAVLEHLHDANRCRALFATHYHEMTALSERLPGVSNATVAVREWKGDVIFLHEVRPGAADRSYGVQVARLAGLPAPVVARARDILDRLEARARQGAGTAAPALDDLPLFAAPPVPRAAPAPEPPSELLRLIADLRPDDLSPREALDLLYRLKSMAP